MKAIRIHEHGGPEVLRREDVPDPQPGPGQVLVKIEAAGINFIEIYQRRGLYQVKLPAILGSEGAGTIAAVGSGVAGLFPGDPVASVDLMGSYAEFALAPADRVVPLPKGLTARDGAAAMLQGMTAHYLACSTFPLRDGHLCVVHAAAGGVGLLLTQIAKMRGARVIGTVSTPEKAALAREAGAADVILYTTQDAVAEVKRLTDGRGVDVVYDSVGRDTFEKSLLCLRPRGMLALFGQSSGPVPPFDPQVLNQRGSLFLTRPKLQNYAASTTELFERASEVLGWVREGKLRLRVWREFPLADVAEAHRQLEARATTGKILLVTSAA